MTDQKYMKPGIKFATGKLVEEIGELQEALGVLQKSLGKSIRFGFYSYDPTSKHIELNIQWVMRNLIPVSNEIKDVEDAIDNFTKEWLNATGKEVGSAFGDGQ